ncbi:MAG: AtzH-like domain-containing protein [Nocardioidaceae bacterium]
MTNDVETLNALFWDDPATVRFGVREELYGWAAVAEYRRGRPPAAPRQLLRTRITTFGRDAAVAVTEYLEEGAPQIGRQTQTWVRMDVWVAHRQRPRVAAAAARHRRTRSEAS